MFLIKNLAGVFTGSGFLAKRGRHPNLADTGYINGPVHILIDLQRKTILSVGTETPAHTLSFDGYGLIATSGFIDSHTHFVFSGNRTHEFFQRWSGRSYQEISASGGGIHNTVSETAKTSEVELIAQTAQKILCCARLGTTCLEIKSGYADSADGEIRLLRVIRELKKWAEHTNAPKIFSTFLALHALPKLKTETAFVDEMIGVLAELKDQKLCDFVDAFPEKGFFGLDEALRFTAAANRFGVPAKVHADELSNLETTAAMVKQGAVSVDHLQMISDAGVAALKSSNTVGTLLPATSFYLGLPYTNARRLIDAGVQVALATDFNPGTAPSFSMLQTNLLAASQLKMSPAEILCATTFNGAAALGISDSHGLLVKDQSANLCLWAQGAQAPEQALEALLLQQRPPQHVFIGGQLLGS